MAVNIQVKAFWVVTPCSVAVGSFCLCLQGEVAGCWEEGLYIGLECKKGKFGDQCC
jgi:hypothetical protein